MIELEFIRKLKNKSLDLSGFIKPTTNIDSKLPTT